MMVARGWARRKRERCWSRGTNFQLCKWFKQHGGLFFTHRIVPQLRLSWCFAVCMHGPLVLEDCSRFRKQEEERTGEGRSPLHLKN